MKSEYDIEKLNPRKNPYTGKIKKQVTINLNNEVIDYFKELSDETGMPYQSLINYYLLDCVKNGKKPEMSWK